ncbi:DUF300-domain-containing protein [Phlegmacium glaucopus]|nr:DUF300-domain-containing protein [Phlegmacium glaucopus]
MAGSGAGSRLPTAVLSLAGISAFVAVLVSTVSILLQLRNYRKPALQRMVVRIMIMVPLYAVSSLISLFSLEAAFVIDAIRDIYEAFVIYCFFVLLLSYLGGERSLLILLQGRPPKEPVFPINLFKREIDPSDPYTFLFLKRGILQYVQVKPVLAAATLILKACGKYNEGDFRANSGYLYISIIYNTSICLSLYCLAMFWVCVNDDLTPFRPVPKFLCVKGILFFSFWQSIAISALVAARIITSLGPYTDPENVSVGLNDLLICIEMPFFAFAHNYAFSYKDYIDPQHTFVARMPMYYAFRDAFGALDVVEDSKATLRGEGMDYREFEPAEGFMHQGDGRDRRIRAGLRYSKGGQRKYWLPKTTEESRPSGLGERVQDVDHVVHLAPDLRQDGGEESSVWPDAEVENGFDLPFGDLDESDEELFAHSQKYLFGDYNYPCIDVSSESARIFIWDEEERVLRDERGAWFSPIRGAKGQAAIQRRERPAWEGYGAVSHSQNQDGKGSVGSKPSTRFYDDEHAGDRVIDHDSERTALPAQPTDVTMKWTRRKDHSHSQTRSSDGPSSIASGSGSSPKNNNSSNRVRSSPIISRHNSRTNPPTLPSDAVDLVFEASHAAEEEQTHERRKGEPTTRTRVGSGLRKVYRRGYSEGENAKGEVEVEDHRDGGSKKIDVGEESLYVVGDDADADTDDDEGRRPRHWPDPTRERVVTIASTPPPHARGLTYNYDDMHDNDNPWA